MIPTVGRTILKECLKSIAEGIELPGGVIVVDQSSTAEIRAWLSDLEALGVKAIHVPSSQTGRASGVNTGIEHAETEFLAITDDDCLVAPDWLQKMRVHLKANPKTVVTGRVEAAGEEEVPLVSTSMSEVTYDRPRLKFDRLSGGNMGVSSSVLDRVGLLDEDVVLRCSEDGEWAYRALRAGVSIKYAPDVVIYHVGWRDQGGRKEQYREYAMSSGGFYGKYMRRGDWFIGARSVVHYLREIRRLVRAKMKGNKEEQRMSGECLRWLIPGIVAGWKSESKRVGGGATPTRLSDGAYRSADK